MQAAIEPIPGHLGIDGIPLLSIGLIKNYVTSNTIIIVNL